MSRVPWPLISIENDEAKLDLFVLRLPLRPGHGCTFEVKDDLFHPWVPDGVIDLVTVAALVCPQHGFYVATEYGARCREYQRIVETERETATAGRIYVVLERAQFPRPTRAWQWPLPNLTWEIR